MKLNLPLVALVALLSLAFTSATVKAADATAPAATSKKKSNKTPYNGTLSAIDTTANTITVTTAAKSLVLAIDAKTTFKRDNKPAALADFKTGEKVTGSYTTEGTTMTAASLHFGSTKAAGKAKPAASTPAPATPAAQ